MITVARTNRRWQFKKRLLDRLALGRTPRSQLAPYKHLLHCLKRGPIQIQQSSRIAADPSQHRSHRQSTIWPSDAGGYWTEERIGVSFWQRMNGDSTAGEHTHCQSAASFESALLRICPEIDVTNVRAARRTQKPCLHQIRPVVRAEELHQGLALGREIPGRNMPLRPWLRRILIELFGAPCGGTNTMPAQDDNQLQSNARRRSFLSTDWSRTQADQQNHQHRPHKSL